MEQPSRRHFFGRALSRRALLGAAPAVGSLAVAGHAARGSQTMPSAPSHAGHDPHGSAGGASQSAFFTAEEATAFEALVKRLAVGQEAHSAQLVAQIDSALADAWQHGAHGTGGASGELTSPEIYRLGATGLDRYSQTRFGVLYAGLTPERADEILAMLDAVDQREAPQRRGGTPSFRFPGLTAHQLDQAADVFGDVSPGLFIRTARRDVTAGLAALGVRTPSRHLRSPLGER